MADQAVDAKKTKVDAKKTQTRRVFQRFGAGNLMMAISAS